MLIRLPDVSLKRGLSQDARSPGAPSAGSLLRRHDAGNLKRPIPKVRLTQRVDAALIRLRVLEHVELPLPNGEPTLPGLGLRLEIRAAVFERPDQELLLQNPLLQALKVLGGFVRLRGHLGA